MFGLVLRGALNRGIDGRRFLSTSKNLMAKKKPASKSVQNLDIEEPPAPIPPPKKKTVSIVSKSQKGIPDFDDIVKKLDGKFGKGSLIPFNQVKPIIPNDETTVISTGSLSADLALGIGGLPRGRIVEIFGPESSGKTSLALSVIAAAHKMGGSATYIDAEHSLDPTWAKRLGVNLDHMLLSQPNSGEEALEIAEVLIQDGKMDVIVVDSVAALVPKSELDGQVGEFVIGAQARLMSGALRKLAASLAKSQKTVMIFINQIRHKVGITFGSPEVTSGGQALKYYATARIDVRKVASLKIGDQIIGHQIRAKIIKNKLYPPWKEALFDLVFSKGISKSGELIDLGLKANLLDKAGAYYSYGEEKLGQGREKAKTYLEENPELMAKLEREIREKFSADLLSIPRELEEGETEESNTTDSTDSKSSESNNNSISEQTNKEETKA